MTSNQKKIEKRLRLLGWSAEEAGHRARIIHASRRAGEFNARGLQNGDCVGVLYSSGSADRSPAEGLVIDGGLIVNGCRPTAGMVGGRLTLPYRRVGGEFWTMRRGDTVAVLGDGTEVRLGAQHAGCYSFEAADRVYPHILAAAMDLTPASLAVGENPHAET